MELIPLWLKIAYTVFTVAIVVVYVKKYPLWNFLWFSDVALIVSVPALWLESSLLASMMLVGVLLPELVWCGAFFTRLLTGSRVFGLTDYMFDATKPRYLRAISLVFHVVLPPLLLWMAYVLGYDSRALAAQTALAWVVLPLSYWLGDPKVENLNWVYGWKSEQQTSIPPLVFLGIIMLAFPLLIYVPSHLVMLWVFG